MRASWLQAGAMWGEGNQGLSGWGRQWLGWGGESTSKVHAILKVEGAQGKIARAAQTCVSLHCAAAGRLSAAGVAFGINISSTGCMCHAQGSRACTVTVCCCAARTAMQECWQHCCN